MDHVAFPTPTIEQAHPHHPEAHNILRMFFRCLAELPDSAWSEVDTSTAHIEGRSVHSTFKKASCLARGLLLEIETSKSLSSDRPYADAGWTERATFHEPSSPSSPARPLARIEIVGSGKIGPDGAMAREDNHLRIHAFDEHGEVAQMGPEHWERALDALDLEGSFGEALAALRDNSETQFASFMARLDSARKGSAPLDSEGEESFSALPHRRDDSTAGL